MYTVHTKGKTMKEYKINHKPLTEEQKAIALSRVYAAQAKTLGKAGSKFKLDKWLDYVEKVSQGIGRAQFMRVNGSSGQDARNYGFIDPDWIIPLVVRQNRYDVKFKIKCAKKIHKGTPVTKLVRDTGVHYSTLTKWYLMWETGKFTLSNARSFNLVKSK